MFNINADTNGGASYPTTHTYITVSGSNVFNWTGAVVIGVALWIYVRILIFNISFFILLSIMYTCNK